ncbi:MAG: helix-turn-helix domain-containing protein [Kiritimatiellae bacterium]|nr:helix-turn-helix domain-containing protein [Kiritimatiellia bacterium]
MREFVRRDEVALHIVSHGRLQVLFAGGGVVVLPPKQLMVSWGGFPHRAEWLEKDTTVYSVQLPLGWILEWNLPPSLIQPLLRGITLLGPEGKEGDMDFQLMDRWTQEVLSKDSGLDRIVLLEIQARLLRLARDESKRLTETADDRMFHAYAPLGRVLRYIAEHFTEPLRIQDVARATGLHPVSVSQMFRRELGIGPAAYLAQCRVAHAQALLASTTLTVTDVAERSGFASVCQFYAAFRKLCGSTPTAYRRSRKTTVPPGR